MHSMFFFDTTTSDASSSVSSSSGSSATTDTPEEDLLELFAGMPKPKIMNSSTEDRSPEGFGDNVMKLIARLNTEIDDHDKRIDAVEKWYQIACGRATKDEAMKDGLYNCIREDAEKSCDRHLKKAKKFLQKEYERICTRSDGGMYRVWDEPGGNTYDGPYWAEKMKEPEAKLQYEKHLHKDEVKHGGYLVFDGDKELAGDLWMEDGDGGYKRSGESIHAEYHFWWIRPGNDADGKPLRPLLDQVLARSRMEIDGVKAAVPLFSSRKNLKKWRALQGAMYQNNEDEWE